VSLPLIVREALRLQHAIFRIVSPGALSRIVVIGLIAGVIVAVGVTHGGYETVCIRINRIIRMRDVSRSQVLIDGAVAPAIEHVDLFKVEATETLIPRSVVFLNFLKSI